jgi:hypothetical protein
LTRLRHLPARSARSLLRRLGAVRFGARGNGLAGRRAVTEPARRPCSGSGQATIDRGDDVAAEPSPLLRRRAGAVTGHRMTWFGEPGERCPVDVPSDAAGRAGSRSAAARAPTVAAPRRSAPARTPAASSASGAADWSGRTNTPAYAAPQRPPAASDATKCNRSPAPPHGAERPPESSSPPRSTSPTKNAQPVRASRYGANASVPCFGSVFGETNSLEGGPDVSLSRSERVKARQLAASRSPVARHAAAVPEAVGGLHDGSMSFLLGFVAR